MAKTTPGLDFLGRKLFVPLALSFVILLVISFLGLRFATWQLVAAPFLGTASYIAAVIALGRWIESLEAARMSSRLAPRCQRDHTVIDRAIQFFCGYGMSDTIPQEIIGLNPPTMNSPTLWFNNIVTTCPEHVKIIICTNPENYVKGKSVTILVFTNAPTAYSFSGNAFSQATRSTLGTGVFTTDGPLWKFHRSVVRPLFLRNRHPTHLDLCDRHAKHAMAHLNSTIDAGYSLDLLSLFRRTSLNVISDMLLGVCVSSLPCPREAYPNPGPSFHSEMDFSTAVLRIQEVISRREELGPSWPLHELLGDKTKEPMRVVCQTLDPLILSAMGKKIMRGVGVSYSADERVTDALDGRESETLLNQLAELTDEPYQIKDVILNILIPQRDNVALTLTSLVYYLALHPRVTSRLRKEVFEYLGPTRRPTGNDLEAMRYLRAVINETLRLAPPVPRTVRETIAATTWPSPHPKEKPIYVPAHTRVSYDVSSIHTSKDLWGPDADHFDPDRFLDGRYQEYLSPNPHIFLPFGRGPRACFGEEAAYDEISVMIVRLLQAHGSICINAPALCPTFRMSDARLLAYKNENGLELRLDGAP